MGRWVAPPLLVTLVGGLWFFWQHPRSPLVRLFDRLLSFDRESGLETMVTLVGAETYSQSIRFLAMPLFLALPLLLGGLWFFTRRAMAREKRLDGFWVYSDRLVIRSEGEAQSFLLEPLLGPLERFSPRQKKSFLGNLKALSQPRQRFFDLPNGALGKTPPMWRGWSFELAGGAAGVDEKELLEAAFESCLGLRQRPGRALLREFVSAIPMMAVLVMSLAAAPVAGLYPWLPAFYGYWACGEGKSAQTAVAVAADRPALTLGCLFLACGKGGDGESLWSRGEHRKALTSYFAAGGDEIGMRLDQALWSLGERRPRVGLAWLSPQGTGLDLRLTQMADDEGLLARLVGNPAHPQLGSSKPTALRAWAYWLQGKPELARQELSQLEFPEEPRGAVLLAVLWELLEDPGQSRQLMRQESVEIWLAEGQGERALERRSSSPYSSFNALRDLAIRSFGEHLLGNCREARLSREAAEAWSRAEGMEGWLDWERMIWGQLQGCDLDQATLLPES